MTVCRLVLALFLSCASVRGQQTTAPAAPQEVTTLHLATQLVLLDASVENRKTGVRIADLTAADFDLKEDSDAQTVSYVSEDRLPLSLILMFDVTDTVQPVLKPLAAGSRIVLSHLRPEDEVAVMTFSSHASLLQDFTTDHGLLEAGIARAATVHDRYATHILQDLFEAAEEMTHSTVPNSRKVAVWLTDGTTQDFLGNNSGHGKHGRPPYKTAEEARDAVLHGNFVVAGLIEHSYLTDLMDPKLLFTGSIGRIGEFGVLTGGPFLRTSKKEVAERFAALLDTLRQRYTLGFKPTSVKPAGTACRLTLELSPGFYARHITLKPQDVLVRTRQMYYR